MHFSEVLFNVLVEVGFTLAGFSNPLTDTLGAAPKYVIFSGKLQNFDSIPF